MKKTANRYPLRAKGQWREAPKPGRYRKLWLVVAGRLENGNHYLFELKKEADCMARFIKRAMKSRGRKNYRVRVIAFERSKTRVAA